MGGMGMADTEVEDMVAEDTGKKDKWERRPLRTCLGGPVAMNHLLKREDRIKQGLTPGLRDRQGLPTACLLSLNQPWNRMYGPVATLFWQPPELHLRSMPPFLPLLPCPLPTNISPPVASWGQLGALFLNSIDNAMQEEYIAPSRT
jgi:hypothetical protein